MQQLWHCYHPKVRDCYRRIGLDDCLVFLPSREQHAYRPTAMENRVARTTYTEEKVEAITLQLLAERGPSKTICPSEVARVMAELDDRPDQWRRWTEVARTVAIQMAKDRKIRIFQRSEEVDPLCLKGPIRLRQPKLQTG